MIILTIGIKISVCWIK